MNESEKLREQLKSICIDLHRMLQEDPEKYMSEIVNLREMATAINLKMESIRSDRVSERIARRER